MKLSVNLARCCLLTALAAGACTSPTRPGVSVASAQPVSPARDASISYYNQPVTLTMTNGVGSAGSATMIVEVAADAAFTTIVASKPVAAGPNDHSSVLLERLNPSTTYYWRIKTMAGIESSALSSSSSFRIGPQEVIGQPTAVQPLANSFPHKRPTFTVKNAVRSGPSTTLSYRFEISADVGFGHVVASGTVTEGVDVTTFVPGIDLVPGSTYFWRARASDASLGAIGDLSAAQVFTTVFPDDGSYRYQLVVQSQPWCANHTTAPPPGYTYPTYFLSSVLVGDFSYDGMLVVAADTLQYRFSDDRGRISLYAAADFELARTAGNVTGTTDACSGQFYLNCVHGTLSGVTDFHGRFNGELAGELLVVKLGIPGTGAAYCAAPNFAWTLLPR